MAQQQEVRMHNTGTLFVFDDFEFIYKCAHEEATVEPPCCTQAGSSGYIECGCGGMYDVICPAKDCTGIEHQEVINLIDEG